MITVPHAFATATVSREGDAGRKWIDTLPGLVEDLCQHWNLRIDGPVMHGYLGLVIPVLHDEEPCVLKISWTDEATAEEAMALAVWNGNGAVRLFASHPASGAMLLERLDHRRSLNDAEIGEAVEVAARLLRRLAIPVSSGFRSLKLVVQDLCRAFPRRWEQYGKFGQSSRPMPRRWMEYACELAAQLGPSSENLLVNYDLHYEDVLRGKRDPWLVVDPKVVIGDTEYGIAQLLWCRLEDIMAKGGLDRHFHMMIEAASLDTVRARSWTIVRCVDYWLWGLSVGLTQDPERCETIVQWLI